MVFECSKGTARPEISGSPDAALPFLSAAAGLLLVVAMLDLGSDATLMTGRINHWRVHLELGAKLWQKLPHPSARCTHTLPSAVRAALYKQSPRRWDVFDRDAET
jgi:hypothetical protein